jgi:hypothetical protein
MPEKVRAKFVCNTVTQRMNADSQKQILWDYSFWPVISGSEENKKFFAYTPSGKIELSSINGQLFEVGKEYYLDFTPAGE